MTAFSAKDLAKYFDHTALKADTTASDIERLCAEAKVLGTASVCVNPSWIPLCRTLLNGSGVMAITVVGFPLGATTTASKVFEAREAIANGAEEIDMVLAIGRLKSKQFDATRNDILSVKHACVDIPLKVIFETSLLTDGEIALVTRWCAEDGIDFVKTSTGFGSRGASVDDVRIMRETILSVAGSQTRIKASGGIRDLKGTLSLIAAGADRIGASATGAIIAELSGAAANQGDTY